MFIFAAIFPQKNQQKKPQNQYFILNWGFPSPGFKFESIYAYKKLSKMSMDCKINIQEVAIQIIENLKINQEPKGRGKQKVVGPLLHYF